MLEGIDATAMRALTGQAVEGDPASTGAAKPFESAVGPLAGSG